MGHLGYSALPVENQSGVSLPALCGKLPSLLFSPFHQGIKPIQQPSLGWAYLELLTPISLLGNSHMYVHIWREKMCIYWNTHIWERYRQTQMDIRLHLAIYPLLIYSLPAPITSEMRKWNAIFGEKTDLSYRLSRKWPSLPPIQTSRHWSAALFQAFLLLKVHTLKLNGPPLAKRKDSTSIAAHAVLPCLAGMGERMSLGFSKLAAQL